MLFVPVSLCSGETNQQNKRQELPLAVEVTPLHLARRVVSQKTAEYSNYYLFFLGANYTLLYLFWSLGFRNGNQKVFTHCDDDRLPLFILEK